MPVSSHKHTKVWAWLEAYPTGPNVPSQLVRAMRGRTDMSHEFATRTQLLNFLLRCKVDPAVAERYLLPLWMDWRAYRDAVNHNIHPSPVRWSKRLCRYMADPEPFVQTARHHQGSPDA